MIQVKLETTVGAVFLVGSRRGLNGASWRPAPLPLELIDAATPDGAVLAESARQIEAYLAGRRRAFDLPLDVRGTEFQRRVWDELSKIPYGQTRSYREIARVIGSANACRAVGAANGRNPLCLVVPCHRVIAADGTLGGYVGGLAVKARLLALERGEN